MGNIRYSDYHCKVLVRCNTYNQSKYILDALGGFAMQKTDFPFLCLVMDDASTDGEQDVIRGFLERECAMDTAQYEEIEEADIIIAPHSTNKNCTFAVYFLKKNLYRNPRKQELVKPWRDECEYEALCEGDDYWISAGKLMRQVAFLDNNLEYSAVFHNALLTNEISNSPDVPLCHFSSGDFDTEKIFKYWQLPLASLVYRNSILNYPNREKIDSVSKGSLNLFILATLAGKVYGISECLSVYRKNEGGISISYSPAYCFSLNYQMAIASGSKGAIKVMNKVAVKNIIGSLYSFIRGNEKVKELYGAIIKLCPWNFVRAIIRMVVFFPYYFYRFLIALHNEL